MWSALRRDLTEFVSTVTEDAAAALNNMDENFDLSEEEAEALRRMKLEETYTTPLNEDDAEAEQFLKDFNIEEKGEEISMNLEKHDMLKTFLDELVPDHVSYAEFWQRYFYRCDPQRIMAEWQNSSVEEEGPMNAIGHLLGDAVKAVSKTLAEDDEGKAIDGNKSSSFFTGSRPPFVMNTALSDGDDNEELGWGDEEDEEDDEEEEEEEDVVVFKDEEKEKLKDELKQALEERDLLQQTVQMQKKELLEHRSASEGSSEIKKLQMQLFERESELAALKLGQLDISVDQHVVEGAVDMKEVGDELFQKQSEVTQQQKQLETLRNALSEKEAEVSRHVDESSKLFKQLEEAQSVVHALQEEKRKLLDQVKKLQEGGGCDNESQLQELQNQVQSLTMEKNSLEETLQMTSADVEARITQMQEKLTRAIESADEANREKEEVSSALNDAKREIEKLGAELNLVQAQARPDTSPVRTTSPDTISTGVKVDSPKIEKVRSKDDDTDDWGDDWGDDGV
ncbi:hypothetical protein FisN_23Hh224 [Fistulifera solaris]|jgi:hypothetical protein|uniref:BSD domain-containing protein n=1 Tax=Fistulifera solaris TaxID=1519565 RepID=A0A1Z5JWC4_FISSO|nr:hypothetical protein FisN_23Hh224 [Fistulifera solaris]|eukprot:GAX18330.1 hypothetical protein FisN_23Hh224 [Fistulifera solaris]